MSAAGFDFECITGATVRVTGGGVEAEDAIPLTWATGAIDSDDFTMVNHPGFDAHLLSREGCSHHGEEVRRG
ncbi:hypothetical protein, partial [Mycobacterium intermedium]